MNGSQENKTSSRFAPGEDVVRKVQTWRIRAVSEAEISMPTSFVSSDRRVVERGAPSAPLDESRRTVLGGVLACANFSHWHVLN